MLGVQGAHESGNAIKARTATRFSPRALTPDNDQVPLSPVPFASTTPASFQHWAAPTGNHRSRVSWRAHRPCRPANGIGEPRHAELDRTKKGYPRLRQPYPMLGGSPGHLQADVEWGASQIWNANRRSGFMWVQLNEPARSSLRSSKAGDDGTDQLVITGSVLPPNYRRDAG